jgi:UDP-3-O-[3-hydroxymyristoyl] glucosamine N-acyltransferase
MLLSEVYKSGNCDIIRDAYFESVGFLSDPQPSMLVFLESRRFLSTLRRTREAGCVITRAEYAGELDFIEGLAISAEPRLAFHQIHEYLALQTSFYWADFDTEIDPTASVNPAAFVAARNVRIGPRTRVEANSTILERCTVGADAVIHSGVVLGSVGFQTTRCSSGMKEMTHAGSVEIRDGAQILANAVVARGVFQQSTVIGCDARIGACAFVSHNVQIGARTFVGHGAVVNGNVNIGEDVWIGPSSSVANGVSIGDRAEVTLGSVVIGNIEPGTRVAGNFAIEHRLLLKHVAKMR